ncbi:MAG: type I-E CRISPR-associated protein Cas5/CasD [Myxococcales bacterium]|nr:type I-E CRISPR-associated protein Cas5/CasD [Myxococcales bacterium]
MRTFLHFRLYGPMASWGEPAANELRPSAVHPSRSAVLGLLGAALGIQRDDATALHRLDDALGLAILVERAGVPMDDYHTTQVARDPWFKQAPRATRADELVPHRRDLDTTLSRRGYRCDGVYGVLAWSRSGAEPLEPIRQALLRPRHRLCLGRLACPPALPLKPTLLEAADAASALAQAPSVPDDFPLLRPEGPQRLFWSAEDSLAVGQPAESLTPRRDRALDRGRWLFAERLEAQARWQAGAP